jgi:hypothetical protein
MPLSQVLRGFAELTALAAALLSCSAAIAGGGPENVLLLVNSRSAASLTIANHYCQLRRIPPSNVVHLDWQGNNDSIDIETFRQQILRPALQVASSRGLGEQIDAIVYSSDFPTKIDFSSDHFKLQGEKSPPIGSLTSLTYLYRPVLEHSPQYASWRSNFYMRQPDAAAGVAKTQGFRGWYGWGPQGELLESGGERYLLSTMLGVTSGRGNTIPEVLSYLRRSVAADGTQPRGTIYYMRSGDVRSTTREPGFQAAVDELQSLGVRAEIIDGTMPQDKSDVQGAMLGTSVVRWADSHSTIRLGAICDNLTSFGGDMSPGAGQTPLTEFLRFGASGSSGTVCEPYAIRQKFPAPAIHVHYARGCSLAEAFYQSVWGPYQLLIVGDPLCRPWARIPRVQWLGVAAGATIHGKVQIMPSVSTGSPDVDRFELFAGGLRCGRCGAGGTLDLDTTKLADGNLELRIVAIDSTPIETQGEALFNVTVSNHGLSCTLRPRQSKIQEGARIYLSAAAPGAQWIAVFQDSRQIGRITGAAGELTLDSDQFGSGPVVLRAIARAAAVEKGYAVATPVTIEIGTRPRP